MKRKINITYIIIVVVLFVSVTIIFLSQSKNNIELKHNIHNVKASYVDSTQSIQKTIDYIDVSEADVFSKSIVFKGKIQDRKYIKINFGNEIEYIIELKVKVLKIIKGNITENNYVKIILEDCNYPLTIGNIGYFMPIKYKKTDIWEQNKNTLYYIDLAKYGLLDGFRYLIIKDDKKIYYDKNTFVGLNDPKSLDEVDDYITKKIGNLR